MTETLQNQDIQDSGRKKKIRCIESARSEQAIWTTEIKIEAVMPVG